MQDIESTIEETEELELEALKLVVEADGLDHAVEGMERLADAAERVANALMKLNGQPHGGIVFQSVGEVTKMTVNPSSNDPEMKALIVETMRDHERRNT